MPRDEGSFGLAVRAKMSPALIFLLSLYQINWGVGMPITLHSRDTVPCSVRMASSSLVKNGALYALGTEKECVKLETNLLRNRK